MLKSMKIPRKLGLSFLTICATAAIVMGVFYTNISSISSSTDANNLSQEIHAKTQALETSLLRQNSQFRGFLVTADETYLKSYNEGRDDYDKASSELEETLTEPAQKAALLKSREETLAWRKDWGDRLIAKVKAGQRDAAEADVRAAGKAVLTSAAVLPLREIKDAQTKRIEENGARQETAIKSALFVLVLGALALMGIAIALAVMLTRLIARPVSGLTRTMADLAAGKNDIAVPDTDRGDELGDMARAVLVFRDAAVAKQTAEAANARAEAEQKMVVETVSAQLSELANGNLTAEISRDFPGDYATVKTNFNAAVAELRSLIGTVMQSASTIRDGSNEIAQASEDLARRTEANAASLEETSAAVTQMDGRLKQTAAAAGRTVQRADGTIVTVSNGRATADEAMQAMTRVADSAKGIDSVIEGLDKIAFQTRVLAMNAAVEAGRAGEAGRGFAVVADLVSALAMRAEEEAGRARDQLTATQTDIVAAVEMVQKVDTALADISGDVGEVHKLLGEMANDNQAQSTAISEISIAIGTMDQSTQQNAAMVEETSAAARNLSGEVAALSEQASRFNVGSSGGNRQSKTQIRFDGPVKPLPAAAVPALKRANGHDDWQSF
ncbi:HAMP domain-containing methyl-accepting chemotaxis protein [Sphingomonas psychrotolerans]|uniref:Methyl-accepting chemotaxis protein n=1 Tax=Sphingomonas psychrotolerans TaxID=1327635 RepID=A0A2K8MR32_9SPHN|nr:methyl-accepting chemotaxis protein [Sphingomonas psychrotolerans]ATY33911.1 methyl-accepting chemotaxis protein [Sphingomonas psychrotolerans]